MTMCLREPWCGTVFRRSTHKAVPWMLPAGVSRLKPFDRARRLGALPRSSPVATQQRFGRSLKEVSLRSGPRAQLPSEGCFDGHSCCWAVACATSSLRGRGEPDDVEASDRLRHRFAGPGCWRCLPRQIRRETSCGSHSPRQATLHRRLTSGGHCASGSAAQRSRL